jgi:hypothetical protein
MERARCQHRRMKMFAIFSLALTASLFAAESTDSNLVTDVWKASGGENWSKVKEVRFTFEVESDGKIVSSAKHNWNVAAGTDDVQWKDKHATADLKSPAKDGDANTAYKRWVNDSYWLLAPLKIRDPEVTAQPAGPKDFNGTQCDTIRLSFGQVGLTPTDQYVMYVDPQTKLLRGWDYIPKEGTGLQATWENYQTFGGLKLATEHHFSGKTIRFRDVEVVTAK